jgi:hypothetical protein
MLFYFLLFHCFCIYLHVYTLFGPPSPAPTPKQNLFCPLVLWFCRRKNIKDDKKNKVFLLVWDKDSYTERFLVFPCTNVLQPKLVHLYQTSSLLSWSPSHSGLYQFKITIFIPNTVNTSIHKFLVSFSFPIPPVRSLPLICDLCPIILLHLL